MDYALQSLIKLFFCWKGLAIYFSELLTKDSLAILMQQRSNSNWFLSI